MKIAVTGCGLRTPLLMHGIARAGGSLPVEEIALYDIDRGRSRLMADLCRPLLDGSSIRLASARSLEEAVENSRFVISSIRPGGIESRANDERVAFEHGFAGQETTGPAGLAMALRSVPAAIEQARVVERRAPKAWIVSFTNPAGMVTQAITTHTGARAVGICDTPAELFHRISLALRRPPEQIECDYLGLNHLGWVRKVRSGADDLTSSLLENDKLLRELYPAELFPPRLIRDVGLIPTEYLFFYYRQHHAYENLRAAGATRGEELVRLNRAVLSGIEAAIRRGDASGGIAVYRSYLNRRNASYMRLEGSAESAFENPEPDWDPFAGATGYHRIAVEAMRALSSTVPARVVLNVPNNGTFPELAADDVIEAPCMICVEGPVPSASGPLPETIRPLVVAVKSYERLAIRAVTEQSLDLAALALSVNPIVHDWDRARRTVEALRASDSAYLGYLKPGSTTNDGHRLVRDYR